jgi:TonB family protein
LRANPKLRGKLVLRFTIAPDGNVSFCEVVSSELNDPDLEQKVVQRVLLFQFEPKNVDAITTTKPIDFFP